MALKVNPMNVAPVKLPKGTMDGMTEHRRAEGREREQLSVKVRVSFERALAVLSRDPVSRIDRATRPSQHVHK
jgi:hypothetical protein